MCSKTRDTGYLAITKNFIQMLVHKDQRCKGGRRGAPPTSIGAIFRIKSKMAPAFTPNDMSHQPCWIGNW